MTKKVILALGCLALLVAFSGAAMANLIPDAITFSYAVSTGTVTTCADASPCTPGGPSLTGGPVTATKLGDIVVKDTNTTLTLDLPIGSIGMIQSDNNTSFVTSFVSGQYRLVAAYNGSAATQVLVSSTGAAVGSFLGCTNCLLGTDNFGTYTAKRGDGGGFGGFFDVTYVSPNILAFFGDTGESVDVSGGTAFTTTNNSWTPGLGATTSSGRLGSGTITIQTNVVPEPATLTLMGTGIVGLAGLIRRKKS